LPHLSPALQMEKCALILNLFKGCGYQHLDVEQNIKNALFQKQIDKSFGISMSIISSRSNFNKSVNTQMRWRAHTCIHALVHICIEADNKI
uniref:Uncharacterized protein n=1 Tax=Echeneis naucrates TaxID=173247 RepID=A0A665UP90_ECHNA